MIFSTSITKGIDGNTFNGVYEFGNSRFQKWHGGRVRHIKRYIDSHLEDEKPNTVILQMGGNDLPLRETPINDIANDIMEAAQKARVAGVEHVFIGGVTIRSQAYAKTRGEDLNIALQEMCEANDFVFIDNTEIIKKHLYDGVHINKEGSAILANNYLKALRSKFYNIETK